MADMTEVQMQRLRMLAEPHPNKSKHELEMGELVLMALGRLAELDNEISGIKGQLGECFDGIEDASVLDMIRSTGRVFAWAMAEKSVAEARVTALEAHPLLEYREHDLDGTYDVGALEGDRNALRERVTELEAGRVEFENVVMAGVATLTRGEGDKLRKAEARVAVLEGEAESIDVADRNARRLEDKCDEKTRTIRELEARVAVLMSGLHETAASLPVHESKELDADNIDDVCHAVKLSLRRYADKVEEVEARVAVLDAENKVTRRATFIRATRDVCSYCGKRALPNEPEAHKVCGPNTAGNYTHLAFGNVQLCPASSIWSTIFWEDAADQRGEGV